MNSVTFMNPSFPSSSSSAPSQKQNTRFPSRNVDSKTSPVQHRKLTGRRQSSDRDAKLLPKAFEPSPNSVVIGKSRISKDAEGNFRLKTLAATFLDMYATASTKADKSEIVSRIVDIVRSKCSTGAFVKHNDKDGRWYECPKGVAREKVSIASALGIRYANTTVR